MKKRRTKTEDLLDRHDSQFEAVKKHYDEMAKDRAEIKTMLVHRIRQAEQKNFIMKALAEHAMGRKILVPDFQFGGVNGVPQPEQNAEEHAGAKDED